MIYGGTYTAILDDGRHVIVDVGKNQTRLVGEAEFFLPPQYVNVLLDGSWQTVLRKRLKTAAYGSPFQVLERRYR